MRSSPPLKFILPAAAIIVVMIAGAVLKPIIAKGNKSDGTRHVSVSELCDAYWGNEVAANNEYDGAMVKFTCRIDKIAARDDERYFRNAAFVDGGKDRLIQCDFHEDVDVSGIKVNKKVTIIGYCSGFREENRQRVLLISGCRPKD